MVVEIVAFILMLGVFVAAVGGLIWVERNYDPIGIVKSLFS